MDTPAPALLAAIVLLLWPAGRLYAVWSGAGRERLGARQPSDAGLLLTLQQALLVTVVLARNLVLLAVMLATILLLKRVAQRIYGEHEPLIFGAYSLNIFFDLAMLSQFAVFTFQSAWDSKRILNEKFSDLRTGATIGTAGFRPLELIVDIVPKRLQTDFAVYASTAAVSAVIFVVGSGLLAHSSN